MLTSNRIYLNGKKYTSFSDSLRFTYKPLWVVAFSCTSQLKGVLMAHSTIVGVT